MKYLILILLLTSSLTGYGQTPKVGPFLPQSIKLNSDLPSDSIHVMISDTLDHIYKARGKWLEKRYFNELFSDPYYDFAFWEKGLTSPVHSPADSAERSGYTQFIGIEDGEPSAIKILKEGIAVFDKKQFGGDHGGYYMKFTSFDTLNRANFNFINSSNQDINYTSRNLESFGIGWNLGEFGTQEIDTQSMMALMFEYNWADPNDTELKDEIQFRHTDRNGNIRRPMDLLMDNDYTSEWSASWAFPTWNLHPPDTTAWYLQYQHDPASHRITQKMADPTTGNGAQFTLDVDDNLFDFGQFGMSNPIFYFSNWYAATFQGAYVQIPTLTGNPATTLIGRDGSNFLTPIPTGDGLSLSGGILSVDPSTPDSIFGSSDTLCFVIMGDTICNPLDSIVVIDGEICYIEMGDTICTGFTTGIVRISDLLGANKTNVIDNRGYTQEWRWDSLATNPGLSLLSNSNHAGSGYKVLKIEAEGGNASGGISTYGLYSSNIRTGSGSQNYGVFGYANSGAANYGVAGLSDSGIGVYGSTDSGTGLHGFAYSGLAFRAEDKSANTNTVEILADFKRGTLSTSTGNGIGGAVTFTNLATGPNYVESNRLTSMLTDATYATRTSSFIINGVNSGTSADLFTLAGSGALRLHKYGIGTFTGTPAYTLQVDASGNVIEGSLGASVAISALTAATGTNTINNADYAQEWQWNGLTGNTGLKITSNSTAATGGISSQRLLDVELSGANSNSGQSTQAGYFSNSHSGTAAVNRGIYTTASGGVANYGIYADVSSTSSDRAVNGSAATGTGVYGSATTGTGIKASVAAGLALHVSDQSTATNTVISEIRIEREVGSGVGANGVGSSIDFLTETSTTTGVSANIIKSVWSNATHASRTSTMTISGVNAGTATDILTLNGDGSTIANGTIRLKGYTVATLPATPTQGDVAFCTDLLTPTFFALAVGGGAVVGPVFFNGTIWITQ